MSDTNILSLYQLGKMMSGNPLSTWVGLLVFVVVMVALWVVVNLQTKVEKLETQQKHNINTEFLSNYTERNNFQMMKKFKECIDRTIGLADKYESISGKEALKLLSHEWSKEVMMTSKQFPSTADIGASPSDQDNNDHNDE
jgi:hypothetical protein